MAYLRKFCRYILGRSLSKVCQNNQNLTCQQFLSYDLSTYFRYFGLEGLHKLTNILSKLNLNLSFVYDR